MLQPKPSLAYGRGGIAFVEREAGIRELKNPEQIDPNRIRKPGGGRKRTVDTDPTLLSDLEKLVDPATDRISFVLKGLHLIVNMLKLRIAVFMPTAFFCFPIRLQTVTKLVQITWPPSCCLSCFPFRVKRPQFYACFWWSNAKENSGSPRPREGTRS